MKYLGLNLYLKKKTNNVSQLTGLSEVMMKILIQYSAIDRATYQSWILQKQY